ncbi:MAG: sigma-70 family RNA polymerase sigma factor [Gammaproteobacteria bacterium]|nr:sigma-70 family RNA polymerase sigma factor [Gammaproteobacteria bacterium]
MTFLTIEEQRRYIKNISKKKTPDDNQESWNKILDKITSKYSKYCAKIGVDLEDLIQEAMMRCWEEDPKEPGYARRKWDMGRVDFSGFLLGIVRSLISQIYKKNKQNRIEDEAMHDLSQIPDIDTQYETIMDEDSFNRLTEKALSLVQDDPKLYAIVKIWARDPEMKPEEVANELNMSPKEFLNLRKRLKSKLNILHEELH